MNPDRDQQRFDPFSDDDDDLMAEIGEFQPKKAAGVNRSRREKDVERIAEASGFNNRMPLPKDPEKEPLKPLQFRIPESQVDAFHREAFEEFGPKHGAKTAFFLKIWEAYRASKSMNS